MVGLYIFGIVMGIITALISKRFLFKGEAVPFVMELPNYRMPSAKTTFQLLWEKAKDFLQRAFGIIFIDFYISALEINIRMAAIGKYAVGIHLQIHQSVNGQLRSHLECVIISGIDGRAAIIAETAVIFHIDRPGVLFIMGIHGYVPIDSGFRIAAQIHAQAVISAMSPDIHIPINRQLVRRILIRSVLSAYTESFLKAH